MQPTIHRAGAASSCEPSLHPGQPRSLSPLLVRANSRHGRALTCKDSSLPSFTVAGIVLKGRSCTHAGFNHISYRWALG
jgi:hypothetical protein